MKRFVAALLLVLWSVSLADGAGASVRVWCIGADGHSSVERLVLADCADFITQERQNDDRVGVSADHCGPCMDVVLASDQNTLRFTTTVTPPQEKLVPVSRLPVLVPVQSTRPTNWTPAQTDPPRPSPALITHRSVVILI